MDDLISRKTAIDALAKFVPYAICDESTESYTNGLTDAYNLICQLPSIQPEIIRCKDCKYIEEHHYEENGEPPYIKYTCAYKAGLAKGYQVHEWDFCSRAERGQ